MKKLYIILHLLFITIAAKSGDFDTLVIRRDTVLSDIGAYVSYFVDTTSRFEKDGVMPDRRLFTVKGFSDQLQKGDYWSHFILYHDTDKQHDYIIELGKSNEVRVFYRAENEGRFAEKITGKLIPWPLNEMANKESTVNKIAVTLLPHTVYEFFLLYPGQGPEPVDSQIAVYGKSRWYEQTANKQQIFRLFWGIFFGALLMLAIVNFIYYFIHRDKAYLNYTVYIATIAYYQFANFRAVEFLPFVKYPHLFIFLEIIVLIVSLIYYLFFFKAFLETKKRYPFWDKVAQYVIYFLWISVLVCGWLVLVEKQPITAIYVRNLFLLAALMIMAVFLANLYKKGSRIDHYFLTGSIVLLIFGLISLFMFLFAGLKKEVDVVFSIGVVIELIIFSVALGVRSRAHEKEKQIAQENLIKQLQKNERLQKSINRELELLVEERTKEIKAQNEELIMQQEELASQRDALEVQNKTISNNMSELKKLKKKLEQLVEKRTVQLQKADNKLIQHSSQIDQCAFMAAHNLRAPLARLKGLMYIFEKTNGINAENIDIVKKISQSVKEMDEVLTDVSTVLEFRNVEDFVTEAVNLEKCVTKTAGMLHDAIKENGAKISWDFQVDEIPGNQPYLENICYNLVSNAIKYRHPDRSPMIRISSYMHNDHVVLKVSDNGRGIDLEKYGEKLFGLYQRFHDSEEGKGIGLSIVKTQVQALGGQISVDSKVGDGTTFSIEFINL